MPTGGQRSLLVRENEAERERSFLQVTPGESMSNGNDAILAALQEINAKQAEQMAATLEQRWDFRWALGCMMLVFLAASSALSGCARVARLVRESDERAAEQQGESDQQREWRERLLSDFAEQMQLMKGQHEESEQREAEQQQLQKDRLLAVIS
eukprot:g17127.t1